MPARYEAMRDKFAKTVSYDKAQEKAAKIYNATRKSGEPELTGAAHRSRTEKKVRKGRRYNTATNTYSR